MRSCYLLGMETGKCLAPAWCGKEKSAVVDDDSFSFFYEGVVTRVEEGDSLREWCSECTPYPYHAEPPT